MKSAIVAGTCLMVAASPALAVSSASVELIAGTDIGADLTLRLESAAGTSVSFALGTAAQDADSNIGGIALANSFGSVAPTAIGFLGFADARAVAPGGSATALADLLDSTVTISNSSNSVASVAFELAARAALSAVADPGDSAESRLSVMISDVATGAELWSWAISAASTGAPDSSVAPAFQSFAITAPALTTLVLDVDFVATATASAAPVNPIPLPATAWLLLGGLGAIGALSRRA